MQVENVVCAFCGFVRDDISLTVEEGRITQAKNACVIGKAWFLSHGQPSDRPPAMIAGQPASLDDAADTAAHILAEARYPLIYVGEIGSLAEGRKIVRNSCELKTYQPTDVDAWEAALDKFKRLLA